MELQTAALSHHPSSMTQVTDVLYPVTVDFRSLKIRKGLLTVVLDFAVPMQSQNTFTRLALLSKSNHFHDNFWSQFNPIFLSCLHLKHAKVMFSLKSIFSEDAGWSLCFSQEDSIKRTYSAVERIHSFRMPKQNTMTMAPSNLIWSHLIERISPDDIFCIVWSHWVSRRNDHC